MCNTKMCILDEVKVCDGCGECLKCDLDPNKICDNCMKCINSEGAAFRAIQITGVELADAENASGS